MLQCKSEKSFVVCTVTNPTLGLGKICKDSFRGSVDNLELVTLIM